MLSIFNKLKEQQQQQQSGHGQDSARAGDATKAPAGQEPALVQLVPGDPRSQSPGGALRPAAEGEAGGGAPATIAAAGAAAKKTSSASRGPVHNVAVPNDNIAAIPLPPTDAPSVPPASPPLSATPTPPPRHDRLFVSKWRKGAAAGPAPVPPPLPTPPSVGDDAHSNSSSSRPSATKPHRRSLSIPFRLPTLPRAGLESLGAGLGAAPPAIPDQPIRRAVEGPYRNYRPPVTNASGRQQQGYNVNNASSSSWATTVAGQEPGSRGDQESEPGTRAAAGAGAGSGLRAASGSGSGSRSGAGRDSVRASITAEHEMDGTSPAELARGLASPEESVRKLAAFKLKDAIGDPSFADVFEAEGGVAVLKKLCMTSNANTLAYSLTSLSNLLEIDKGWECLDQELVQRLVALLVKEPLVNILRGAMSILVATVQRGGSKILLKELNAPEPGQKQLGERYRLFLEMLVSRLSSADHALCANALQLINSLMRDAITGGDNKWPQFIKQVQDLGVIRAVYSLMQSTALQDLAQPLLEFQTLTKVLLRKWRDVAVDLKRVEHQKAMKGIQAAASKALEREVAEEVKQGYEPRIIERAEIWKRLGFQDDNKLEPEFDEVGFLGMMDLADYVRKTEDGFEKLVLEQGMQQDVSRCPIARASIAITSILYDHFDIDNPELEDVKEYLALDGRNGLGQLFKPMLLQWSKLHTAGLQSYLRLWKATGARMADFDKVTELIRILIDAVVGAATRTKEIGALEEEIASYDCQTLRELQMELVELAYEDSWGEHLKLVREELHHEALLFIQEQRIRCMLAGSWFPRRSESEGPYSNGINGEITSDQRGRANWRYAKLSHNRRYLHYGDFEHRPSAGSGEPNLDELMDKIDLQTVSSVISNVVPLPSSPASSTATLPATATADPVPTPMSPTSRIVINTLISSSSGSSSSPPPKGALAATQAHHAKTGSDGSSASQRREVPLLTLYPATPSLASEWLDGLLMLLNQAPITDETKRLLSTVGTWGLKIRLLNVSFDDAGSYAGEDGQTDGPVETSLTVKGEDGSTGLPRVPGGRGVVPSREGLDEDYYYDVFGGA